MDIKSMPLEQRLSKFRPDSKKITSNSKSIISQQDSDNSKVSQVVTPRVVEKEQKNQKVKEPKEQKASIQKSPEHKMSNAKEKSSEEKSKSKKKSKEEKKSNSKKDDSKFKSKDQANKPVKSKSKDHASKSVKSKSKDTIKKVSSKENRKSSKGPEEKSVAGKSKASAIEEPKKMEKKKSTSIVECQRKITSAMTEGKNKKSTGSSMDENTRLKNELLDKLNMDVVRRLLAETKKGSHESLKSKKSKKSPVRQSKVSSSSKITSKDDSISNKSHLSSNSNVSQAMSSSQVMSSPQAMSSSQATSLSQIGASKSTNESKSSTEDTPMSNAVKSRVSTKKSTLSKHSHGNKSTESKKTKSKGGMTSHRKSHESSVSSKSKMSSYCSSSASTTSSKSVDGELPLQIGAKVQRIETIPGATMVRDEAAINSAGFTIERVTVCTTEYSKILKAHRLEGGKHKKSKAKKSKAKSTSKKGDNMVVKVTNLTECSPRFRVNLLKNSVRIMRFIGAKGVKQKQLSPLFIKVFDIFQMESVRLYIFMEECSPQPTLYDLVRINEPIKPDTIRNYIKAIVCGIRELQKVGVAHRNLKLQHIIFDKTGHPKLCGWSKSVLYYDPHRNRILLQQKERRVRRNYFLPPEAFRHSYDPSKADLWSIGVLLVAMCTKRYPFNVRDTKSKFSTQWRQFVKKVQMNTFVRNLCNKIFIINPKFRITPVKILEDRYFKVPLSKLIPLSIRADPDMMEHESLRVGAVSATDVDSPPQPKTEEEKEAIKEDLDADQKQALEEKNEEVEGDESQGSKPDDGGSVGDEENLPQEELEAESQIAEMNAPEEAEEAANPDDGGAADPETQQEYEG